MPFTDEELIQHITEAAAAAVYEWERFDAATTPSQQASHLVELSNRMFDLSTWLPGFDAETGEVDWDAS